MECDFCKKFHASDKQTTVKTDLLLETKLSGSLLVAETMIEAGKTFSRLVDVRNDRQAI